MSDVTTIGRTPDAAGPGTVRLEFAAGPNATAPLTWGQRVMWGPILWFGKEANQFNINRPLVLSAPIEQSRLLTSLRGLIERHQTLRSRYVDREDGPRQYVLGSGHYEIALVDDQGDPARVIEEVGAATAEPLFDHEAEWPMRVAGAVDRSGRLTAVAVVFSHLAFDGWSSTTLVDYLLALLDDAAPPAPEPDGAVLQPLDQAAFQGSPAGLQVSRQSLAHWEQRLETAPASMFDLPRLPTGELPLERHVLDSRAVVEAGTCLAARTRTSFSSVMLCLTALILTAYNGHDTAVLKLVSGNRLDRRSREMIAINAEDAFLTFPVPDADLLTAVRQIHRSAFDSYRRTQYDPFQLIPAVAQAGRRRGVSFDLSAYFNNGHRGSDWPAGGPEPEPAHLDRLRAESRYWRMDSLSKSDMKYYVAATNLGDGRCRLATMLDTAYLPGSLGEVILRGIETLVCDAVAGEVRISEIAERIGMAPARRGPDWVRTPAGWVRPDDVASLVRAAAGGAPTAVLAQEEAGSPGVSGLTAYVAGPGSVEELHRRVLDSLPEYPTAAAPAEYVLCAAEPASGSGPDGWRSATVVARGPGRPESFDV